METAQIQKQFSNIEQCVKNAAMACQSNNNVPENLKSSLSQLQNESNQARQVMQGNNNQEMQDCVDRLEELGDQAMQACKQAGSVDPQLKDAVTKAHDAISSLKHQLH
jgi:ABC-type transporter Mla subunit MlaD